jgi:hypothetical protein
MAKRMVEWAGVHAGQTILEPSVGGGSIAREILAKGAGVLAFELDIAWAHALKQDPTLEHVVVTVADFLVVNPVEGLCDLAVMNPNLTDGVGPKHVSQALQWCPRVVSVLRLSDLVGIEHYEVLWKRCWLQAVALMNRRPVFAGDGGKTDFCVVDVTRPSTRTTRDGRIIEWWD